MLDILINHQSDVTDLCWFQQVSRSFYVLFFLAWGGQWDLPRQFVLTVLCVGCRVFARRPLIRQLGSGSLPKGARAKNRCYPLKKGVFIE